MLNIETLRKQIGGTTLLAIAAKDYVYSDTSLTFGVKKSARGLHKIKITLTPDDLYTVEYFHFAAKTYETKTHTLKSGISCEMISNVVWELGK